MKKLLPAATPCTTSHISCKAESKNDAVSLPRAKQISPLAFISSVEHLLTACCLIYLRPCFKFLAHACTPYIVCVHYRDPVQPAEYHLL